jgi:hypothetical protein
MTQHSSFFTNVAVGVTDNGKLECTNIRATSSDIASYQVFFTKVSRLIQMFLGGDEHMDKKTHVIPRND